MLTLDCSISLRSAGRRPLALALETLEGRITPADFMWSPTLVKGVWGNTWSTPTNWDLKDINGDYRPQFTAVPGAGDSVVFPDKLGVTYCFVDVAGGATVKSLICSGGYGLILTNSLTVDGGRLSRFAYMSIRADTRNNPSARGVLTLTNGADLDWRRGQFDSIDVNIVNSSSMSAYALDYADNGGATYNHDMENTRININTGATLKWYGSDVRVDNLRGGSSEVCIGSGGRFEITGGRSWRMTTPTSPAYFKVVNNGTVQLNATGTAAIVGDYMSSGLTRLDMGILQIDGKAEQTSGTFELRDNTTIKVGGADSLLGIRGGSIVGQGTVDGNLVLGYDPMVGGGQTSGFISPGIDVVPAGPGAGPIVRGVGTITISAAFHIFSGGMTIDFDAAGNYDKIVVQGPYAALTGSLFIRGDDKYRPAQPVTMSFLTAAAIYGDFSSKTSTGIAVWLAPNGMDSTTLITKKTGSSYNIESFDIIGPH